MKKNNYLSELGKLILKAEVNDSKNWKMSFDGAILSITDSIVKWVKKGNKLIIIGNGGSASIASHIATDFLKNAAMPALAFNDSALITCLSNDLGYEYVFEKPMEMLSQKGDILFAISSSGKSRNILNAAEKAIQRGCFLVTLSGFSSGNPLRKLGDINFYIPSSSYGYVEIAHLAICHCVVDTIIQKKETNG